MFHLCDYSYTWLRLPLLLLRGTWCGLFCAAEDYSCMISYPPKERFDGEAAAAPMGTCDPPSERKHPPKLMTDAAALAAHLAATRMTFRVELLSSPTRINSICEPKCRHYTPKGGYR